LGAAVGAAVLLSCSCAPAAAPPERGPTPEQLAANGFHPAVPPPEVMPTPVLVTDDGPDDRVEVQHGVLYAFTWLAGGAVRSVAPTAPVPWPAAAVSRPGRLMIDLGDGPPPTSIDLGVFGSVRPDGTPVPESGRTSTCIPLQPGSCATRRADGDVVIPLGGDPTRSSHVSVTASWYVHRAFIREHHLPENLTTLTGVWLFTVRGPA
jgi:hypothetical protein